MVRVACLVTVLLLAVGTAFAATPPPKDLHFVRDHWTPYNPPDPATFPPGANVHIIVKGDTLWGLAQTFYGDPYLWPQLWEANTYITDAHWIYPGDPLLVPGESGAAGMGTTTALTAVGEGEETELSATEGFGTGTGGPELIALGSQADIYCYGYLGRVDEQLPNRIEAFEDYEVKWTRRAERQESGVTVDDIVFIDIDAPGWLQAGETYLVVKPAEIVKHPKTGETIGRHYDYRGQVRILCIIGDQATAIVTQSCKPINIGDALKPVPVAPIPLVRPTEMAGVCDPPSGRTAGFIVNSKDFREVLGEGAVVEINLGRSDLVEPGSFLTVYRESPTPGNPRLILGEIGVLTAEADTATAKILSMRYSMRVGDRVEIK